MRPRRHDHASPLFFHFDLGLGSTEAELELAGASQAQIEATDAIREPLPCYSLFLSLLFRSAIFFTRAQIELAFPSAFLSFSRSSKQTARSPEFPSLFLSF